MSRPFMNKCNLEMQLPQMPILGPHDFDLLLQNIEQAIVDEATAADFYRRLLDEAPDELHEEFIEHAYEDELEHLEAFQGVYEHFTGHEMPYEVAPVEWDTYQEAILMALMDELEAVEFYRDIQLSTTDQLVRDVFFHAMVDELEHATQFGVLYNTLK